MAAGGGGGGGGGDYSSDDYPSFDLRPGLPYGGRPYFPPSQGFDPYHRPPFPQQQHRPPYPQRAPFSGHRPSLPHHGQLHPDMRHQIPRQRPPFPQRQRPPFSQRSSHSSQASKPSTSHDQSGSTTSALIDAGPADAAPADTNAQEQGKWMTPSDVDLECEKKLRKEEDDELERLRTIRGHAGKALKATKKEFEKYKKDLKKSGVVFLPKGLIDFSGVPGGVEEATRVEAEFRARKGAITDGMRAFQDSKEGWKNQRHVVDDRRTICPLKDHFPPVEPRPVREELKYEEMNRSRRRAFKKQQYKERRKEMKKRRKKGIWLPGDPRAPGAAAGTVEAKDGEEEEEEDDEMDEDDDAEDDFE